MKRTSCLLWIAFAVGWCVCAGSMQVGEASSTDSPATGLAAGVPPRLSDHGTNQAGRFDNQLADDPTIAEMKRVLDASRRHQHKLPNFVCGPGLWLPIGVNFYEMFDRHAAYLLCMCDVSENHYDQSNEPAWFEAALLQIRGAGPDAFSPIKWVAVSIGNRAEHQDESTFEQSIKVGAIFKASEVFDFSNDIHQLVAQAVMDRHPIMYDRKRETPGEQERWVIVERHAATNHTATGSN